MRMRIAALLAAVCLLTGCTSSLLERQYTSAEEHSSKYWESDAANTMRAESYQDLVNDLLFLVGRHTEDAILRLYDFEDDAAVADALEKAAVEVQQETPMGAYAVEYIAAERQRQRGYYGVNIRIGYRRTTEQMQAMVNATSTSALPDLIDSAMENGRSELAVRVGYWGEDEQAAVEQMVSEARERWELTGAEEWTVSYYPAQGAVGVIEFTMPTEPAAESEEPDGEDTQTEDGETAESEEEAPPADGQGEFLKN